MQYGLIGKSLKHSFSKQIHESLADYSYELKSIAPENIDAFMKAKDFRGINVTIPYKQTVLPYLDELSENAKEIGCVNVVINKDGHLYGDNTDIYGMIYMIRRAGISIENKKVLILGSGGTSLTARCAARRLRAKEILVISRSGGTTYADIPAHLDADIIINTTPVGMFPNNGECLLEINDFKNLSGVIDVVYNPLKTKLILSARDLNIPSTSGLPMLVAQAKRACEQFVDTSIEDEEISRITNELFRNMSNIVLIGMPGCGKSQIGKKVAEITGMPHIDIDSIIEQREEMKISDIFAKFGEAHFRALEKSTIAEFGALSGQVISIGGGAVKDDANYYSLKQNGTLFFIKRSLDLLPTDGRPLSKGENAIEKLYKERIGFYNRFADISIDNNETIDTAAQKILEAYNEVICD